MIKQYYINSCKCVPTPRVIMLCWIKAELEWISQFSGSWWSFKLEICAHIEGTFFPIASFSTNKSSQSFGSFCWWGCYRKWFFACLTVFVQRDLDKPFCIIEIDGYTIVFGLWSDEWWKILNQNRKLDRAMCWLTQNLRRCQMANF